METAGVIARRHQQRIDGSRRSDEFLMLAPWVTEWPDGTKVQPADSAAGPSGEPASSQPEAERHSNRQARSEQERPRRTTRENGTAGERDRVRAKADSLPDDFPEHLKPHARRVFAILRDIAEQHNAREVTPRGIGLAIQGHPGRRFVGVAYELASWAQTPSRPVRDVVGTYRTFLDRAPTYAGVEQFDTPPVGIAASSGNVHAFPPGGRPTRFDVAQAGLKELHDRLISEGK
jgi:hypothetical protein